MFDKAIKSIKHGISNVLSTQGKQTFRVNGKSYSEERLIAEGGYGYVYSVEDGHGNKYALKKINIISDNQLKIINQEISTWKKINNTSNIIKLLDYEKTNDAVYILMELCTEGSLLDYINNFKGNISEREALEIIKNIATALYGMHSFNPPISHRDIKIENVLKFGNKYKLCDFGSASTEVMNPSTISKQQLLDKFDEYGRTTTFMYRPPEMLDEYCNYIVNEKVDVWAVGCILYTILFKMHPFQDAQKLTITSAHYYIPKESKNYSPKIIDFIRLMLTPNPANRPSIRQVLQVIQGWNGITEIPLSDEVKEIKKKQLKNLQEKSSSSAKEISAEELLKAQQSIMKDLKKKNKYKKKETDDLDDLFDDGDEYYKSNPEKRQYNENKSREYSTSSNQMSGIIQGTNSTAPSNNYNNNNNNNYNYNYKNNINDNNNLLFDFGSGFSNSNNFQQHSSQQNSSIHNTNNMGFDFDFDFTQSKSNMNQNQNNQNNQRSQMSFGNSMQMNNNFYQQQQQQQQQKSTNQQFYQQQQQQPQQAPQNFYAQFQDEIGSSNAQAFMNQFSQPQSQGGQPSQTGVKNIDNNKEVLSFFK